MSAPAPPATVLPASERVTAFLVATFALGWTMTIALAVFSGGAWTPDRAGVPGVLVLCTPAIAALVVQRGVLRAPLREPLGLALRPNRWLLVAWLLPIPITLLALGCALLLPGVRFDPAMHAELEHLRRSLTPEQLALAREALPSMPLSVSLSGLASGATIGALLALGQELGFRGFLPAHAQGSPLRAALLAGLAQGLWLVPLGAMGYPLPGAPVAGGLLAVAYAVALAPLAWLVRVRSNSVAACAVLVGTLTGLSRAPMLVLDGGEPWLSSPRGVAGVMALAAASGLAVLLDRRTKSPVFTPRV